LLARAGPLDRLAGEFEVYGTSPHFLTDWRWYKDIHGEACRTHVRAREGYLANVHSFLDHRFVARLLAACEEVFEEERLHRLDRDPARLERMAARLTEIEPSIAQDLPETARALADFREALPGIRPGGAEVPGSAFASWWGRGQQYLSCLRIDPGAGRI
jgi:hypothetical protein